jgi:glycosyltransferase involved in cell wall biosynthesis
MKDDRNFPTEYSKYFIDKIDYKELNKHKNISNGIKVLTKSIYSVEAKRKIKLLLEDNQVDLVHLNNIHHYITPSILSVIKKRKIPVILTLHDYTILCPENSFISNGVICEKCRGGHYYQCAFNRCKKNSYLASSAAALENYIHKLLKVYSYVDYFICPSIFLFNKFKEYGFYTDKLIQVYYSYDLFNINNVKKNDIVTGNERYIVFVGRLEKIKGIYTLLNAMKLIPDIKLKIIGDGTQDEALKMYKNENNLQNVEFLGKRSKEEVLSILYNSEFLICPSEWYEVLGSVNLEAMLLGKPIIGSRIGAIPEMVIDGETGLLFEPGNYKKLSEKIKTLFNNKELIQKMSQNASSRIKNLMSYENHFKELKKIIPNL